MSANSEFQIDQTSGWRRGLNNLMNAEMRGWWRTSSWWTQALIWTLILGSMAGLTAFSQERIAYTDIVVLYSIFAGMFSAIAVVIVMQDSLVGEKQNGTAAWILSKPVSRTAFITSKLLPNWLGFVVNILVIPTILVFTLHRIVYGEVAQPLNYLAAIGVMSLILLYYQALTLMLGALFNHRGPVIGIPLALLFLQQYLVGMLPALRYVTTWRLVVPSPGTIDAIVPALILGQANIDWLPLLGVVVTTLIFIAVAIWRFNREEF